MNNIVVFEPRELYGITSADGIAVVSSRKVAEVFKKEHKNVLQAIENTLKDLTPEFGKLNFQLSQYIGAGEGLGKKVKYKEYLMTRDGFTLLAMGFTGKRAMQFKIDYIKAFNEMEKYIASRELARMEYPHLTDAIKDLHDPPKHYHFSNEADMINRIVLGMSAKEFRLHYGLSPDEPLRDHLTLQQIEAIVRLQKADEVLATMFPDYKVRKAHLEQYYRKTVLKAMPAAVNEV